MLVRAGSVVVLVPVNVSGFRPVLARGWHGQTSSLSGNSIGLACSWILVPTCCEWSARVRRCPSLSAPIVTQLVIHAAFLAACCLVDSKPPHRPPDV